MRDNTDVYGRLGTDPVTAMSPSSMAGGNRVSDSARQTMTAPGSDPVDPMPPADLLGDVTIGAAKYDTPVRVGAGGAKATRDRADRSGPWTNVSGARWDLP
jgi:hypothetical protein